MPHETYQLTKDALLDNGIKDDADFLGWIPTAVEVICHQDAPETLDGPIGNNTWLLKFMCDEDRVELCLEQLKRPGTEDWGLLSLNILRQKAKSPRSGSVSFETSYAWQDKSTTIKQLLEHALSKDWHKYIIFPETEGGPLRGRRDHLYAMLIQMQVEKGWIETGTSGYHEPIKQFLTRKYVWVRDKKGRSVVAHRGWPIRRGIMPAKMISRPPTS